MNAMKWKDKREEELVGFMFDGGKCLIDWGRGRVDWSFSGSERTMAGVRAAIEITTFDKEMEVEFDRSGCHSMNRYPPLGGSVTGKDAEKKGFIPIIRRLAEAAESVLVITPSDPNEPRWRRGIL